MTSSSKPNHVVVIGAGIFGVSAALHLARLGVDVTIVNDGAPAGGASGRSLSWLNSARRTDTPYYRLRLAGIDRYRTLAATQPGTAAWLRFDGGLTWDADEGANGIASIWQLEQEIGYHALLLSPAEVAAMTPASMPTQSRIRALSSTPARLGGSAIPDRSSACRISCPAEAGSSQAPEESRITVAGGRATAWSPLIRSQSSWTWFCLPLARPRLALSPIGHSRSRRDTDFAAGQDCADQDCSACGTQYAARGHSSDARWCAGTRLGLV